MNRSIWRRGRWALVALGLIALGSCKGCADKPESGKVLDEARLAGRAAASFPAAGEDYFHDMDGGVALTPDEIKGRNTWIVWTAGNDHFWDTISMKSLGTLDFLKTLSSHPKRSTACDQHSKGTNRGQEIRNQRSRVQNLFEVVEHEQRRTTVARGL